MYLPHKKLNFRVLKNFFFTLGLKLPEKSLIANAIE